MPKRNRIAAYFPADATEQQRAAMIIEELFDDNAWFRIPKIFVHQMGTDEAIMLAYLIFQSNRIKAHERRKGWDGWFYCRLSQMEKDLQILPRRQQRILKKLKNKRLIGHCRKGIPPRRYFKIQYDQIHKIFLKKDT